MMCRCWQQLTIHDSSGIGCGVQASAAKNSAMYARHLPRRQIAIATESVSVEEIRTEFRLRGQPLPHRKNNERDKTGCYPAHCGWNDTSWEDPTIPPYTVTERRCRSHTAHAVRPQHLVARLRSPQNPNQQISPRCCCLSSCAELEVLGEFEVLGVRTDAAVVRPTAEEALDEQCTGAEPAGATRSDLSRQEPRMIA